MNESLEVTPSRHLDLGQLHLAARINISEWRNNKQSKQYISFIKGKGGKKVSDYFRDFIGCQEGVDSPSETRTLLKAFSDFVESEDMAEEQAREKTETLVDYATSQARIGEPMTVTFYLRNGYSQCTQFLHRVHELAIAFYPAVLEFEGMDVVVLAIALRIPWDQRLAAPVALDPEVVRILGLEDPHVVPLPVGEAALEPLGEPPEALMAPENQGFTAFRGPVAGAAVLDEQAVPLIPRS